MTDENNGEWYDGMDEGELPGEVVTPEMAYAKGRADALRELYDSDAWHYMKAMFDGDACECGQHKAWRALRKHVEGQ